MDGSFCFRGSITFKTVPQDIDTFITKARELGDEACNGHWESADKSTHTFDMYYVDYDDVWTTIYSYIRKHVNDIVPTIFECWDESDAEAFEDPNFTEYFGLDCDYERTMNIYRYRAAIRHLRCYLPKTIALAVLEKELHGILHGNDDN